MLRRLKYNSRMVQALTILSALQLFSEGVPGANGSGEPYGISRGVVEEAARAGVNLRPGARSFDLGVPALSQIASTPASASAPSNQGGSIPEAQKTEMPACNNGRGVLRFERMPDVRRSPSSEASDVVRLSEIPADVLFKCQNFCLKDEKSGVTRKQPCGSFDFLSGKRISTYSQNVQYTESKCFLAVPDDNPGRPPKYEKDPDYYHYREVCYSGSVIGVSRAQTDCPERLYVMERLRNKRFIPTDSNEVANANSLEECQEICLNQASEDALRATTICRSGSFNHQHQRCYLSLHTRRTRPNELQNDPAYDYFENTCLDVDLRCPMNKLYWMEEKNAELNGPYDLLSFPNMTLKECQAKCVLNKNIFCRSLEFDQISRICVISDEDSISRPAHMKRSTTEKRIYMELKCLTGRIDNAKQHIGAASQNPDRQPLSDRNMKEIQTAFQLVRNSRLELDTGFQSRGREGTQVTLAECLDTCLEERNFPCRSVHYSELRQSCTLSEMNRVNGRLAYDPDTHYFENLMGGSFLGSRTNQINPYPGNSGSNSFLGRDRNVAINRFSSSSGSGFGNRFNTLGGSDRRIVGGNNFDRFANTGNRVGGTGFGTLPRDRGFNTATDSRNRFGNADKFTGAFDRFHENRLGNTGGRTGGFSSGAAGPPITTGADRFAGSSSGFGNTGSVIGGGSRFGSGSRFETGRGGSGSNIGSGSRFGSNSGFFGSNVGSNAGSFGSNVGSFGSNPGSFGSNTGSFGSNAGSFGASFGSTGGTTGFSSFGSGGSSSRFRPATGNRFGTSSSGFGSTDNRGVGGSGAIDSSRFGPPTGISPFSGVGAHIGEVSQQCNPDGSMEFMLRTPEPFRGRIYTHGYYDRCFYRGGGSTVNMLKISPPRGFPDCGTERFSETTTSIVVVQFADGVMTSSDKRYNLTCTIVGPGDTVVTSEYIGSGLGAPIPIEYLPEKSTLSAAVRLMILYGGRPTTTVAVGDPLTFRIEPLSGRGLLADIFATNVVARDPITGRAIELIDSRGCPVQTQVFPALGKARSGDGLEARFSAFKIPESNVMVFEAKVRMCRRECDPAVCTVGPGRSEAYSFGRRRRSAGNQTNSTSSAETSDEHQVDEDFVDQEEYNPEVSDYKYAYAEEYDVGDQSSENAAEVKEFDQSKAAESKTGSQDDEEASINEIIRVYMNREEAHEYRDVEASPLIDGVCIPPSEYYSLVCSLAVILIVLVASLCLMAYFFRKYRMLSSKNETADSMNPRHASRSVFPGSHPRTLSQPASYFPSCEGKDRSSFDIETSHSSGNRFCDPSEPIYTDPALFEKSDGEAKRLKSETSSARL